MSTAVEQSFDPKSSVWADVTPVPQDDGEEPIVQILYPPEYSQAMDLLRALLPADELSARALSLTEFLARTAPSSYTVWYYRARILIHGPEDDVLGKRHDRLVKELDFLDDLAKTHMKNYQVWQHRKLIIEALGDPSREVAFTGNVFDKDAKNYHTWVYREWMLARFGGMSGAEQALAPSHPHVWDGELEYIEKLLVQDARNNSAWHHRYYCIFASKHAEAESGNGHRLCTEVWQLGSTFKERIEHEVEYTKMAIKRIPHNASAWNYLRGVSKLAAKHNDSLNPFASARELAQSLLPSDDEAQHNPAIDSPPRSPPMALEWLLDDVDATLQGKGLYCAAQAHEQDALLAKATHLVARLTVADVIRKRFWTYRLATMRKRATGLASQPRA